MLGIGNGEIVLGLPNWGDSLDLMGNLYYILHNAASQTTPKLFSVYMVILEHRLKLVIHSKCDFICEPHLGRCMHCI